MSKHDAREPRQEPLASKENQMTPLAVTTETLAALLEDMMVHVRQHDSHEGSLTYWLPEPPSSCDRSAFTRGDWVLRSGEIEERWACPECGQTGASQEELASAHDGDPATTPDGEPTEYMMSANFRVGNAQGQGGMVIIGSLQ